MSINLKYITKEELADLNRDLKERNTFLFGVSLIFSLLLIFSILVSFSLIKERENVLKREIELAEYYKTSLTDLVQIQTKNEDEETSNSIKVVKEKDLNSDIKLVDREVITNDKKVVTCEERYLLWLYPLEECSQAYWDFLRYEITFWGKRKYLEDHNLLSDLEKQLIEEDKKLRESLSKKQ